jgi:hypothetical protein
LTLRPKKARNQKTNWKKERRDAHIHGEHVEGLVVVVELDEDAADGDEAEDVGARIDELVFARKGEFDRDTKALDEHDGDGADDGGDGDVHDGVRAAVFGDNHVREYHGEDAHGEAVQEKPCARSGQFISSVLAMRTWLQRVFEEIDDGFDLLVVRGVKDNDH